jgi:hypothetical protein
MGCLHHCFAEALHHIGCIGIPKGELQLSEEWPSISGYCFLCPPVDGVVVIHGEHRYRVHSLR